MHCEKYKRFWEGIRLLENFESTKYLTLLPNIYIETLRLCLMLKVVFPTGEDSTETSQDKLGQNVCPRTKKILVSLTLCPGPRAGKKSWDIEVCSRTKLLSHCEKKNSKKENCQKKVKKCIFFLLFSFCPKSQPETRQERQSKSCLVPSHGNMSKSCPGTSHGKILSLSCCPCVPGQWGNFCSFVPRLRTVPSCWKPLLKAFNTWVQNSGIKSFLSQKDILLNGLGFAAFETGTSFLASPLLVPQGS